MITNMKESIFLYELLKKHPELSTNESYNSIFNHVEEQVKDYEERMSAWEDSSKPLFRYVGEREIYDWGDGTYRLVSEGSVHYKVINSGLLIRDMRKNLLEIIS